MERDNVRLFEIQFASNPWSFCIRVIQARLALIRVLIKDWIGFQNALSAEKWILK